MKSKDLCAALRISNLTLAIVILLLLPLNGAVLSQSNSVVVNDVSWNSNGTLLATARNDGTVEIISTTGQAPVTLSVYSFPLMSVAWNPIDDTELAIGSQDGTVRILDINGGQFNVALDSPSNMEFARKVEWSPDGVYLASIETSGSGLGLESEVNIWDINAGSIVQTYADGYSLTDIAWNPQNPNSLLITEVANNQGAKIALWDAVNDTILWTVIQPDDGVTVVAWSPDGTKFATMTEGQSDETFGSAFVRIYDGGTGNLLSTLPTGMSHRGAIAWSPGQHLAVSDLSVVQVWNITTVQLLESIQPTNAGITLTWSPDGSSLAFGGTGGIVEIAQLFETPTPTPTATETPTNTPTATLTPTGSSELAPFVVLGQEGIHIEQNATVVSGDVAANSASSGPFLAQGSEVTIGIGVDFLDPGSRVLGDSVYVRQNAEVYDVYYNEIGGQGNILGQQFTPLALPLVSTFPTLPEFTPGQQDFDIAQDSSLTLDAGDYGTLLARNGSTITLTGGVYNFLEWDVRDNVLVYASAPVEIRVADKLRVESGSYAGPDPAVSGLDATDVVIYVNGQNGNNGNLGATPKAAHFGINSTVIANVYAPNGTLWIRQGSTARGAFLARWVDIGISAEITLESGF